MPNQADSAYAVMSPELIDRYEPVMEVEKVLVSLEGTEATINPPKTINE